MFQYWIKTAYSPMNVGAALLLSAVVSACGGTGSEPEVVGSANLEVSSDPIGICNQDPRVQMNMVPLQVCAGARVFFDETFGGNGRTCGSCHSAANNFTVDAKFVSELPATDPLFVFETTPGLASLETSNLRGPFALVKENVDGFESQDFKFVSRSVPHTLSLATSITRDPGDGTSAAVTQRTGWGGDGAPGDGSLRSFVEGAIKQHYPKDLSRTPGVSFRLPTNAEKDQVVAFQLALGRTADINLSSVSLSDVDAERGRVAFMDPMRGRCNECHKNAGATFNATGFNRNLDTGVTQAPTAFVQQPDGSFLFDGGFGGQNLTAPNFKTVTNAPDSFGDGTFSPPPLIEAADTAPFFHTHGFGSSATPTDGIETAVSFYATDLFLKSPAAHQLDVTFGAPVNLSGDEVPTIGRFLRVLNASFNLAMAKQRLDASYSLNVAFWGYRDDIQKGLLRLANEEVTDARNVLANGVALGPLHASVQTTLQNVQTLLSQAQAASDPAVRRDKTNAARTAVQSAKAAFGNGMNFTLGTGNLMF